MRRSSSTRAHAGLGLALGALLTACIPLNVQQQAGFARADVRPVGLHGKVGDVVRFDVLPPVSRGTSWDLDVYNRVRFVGDETSPHREWVAEHEPIHLEAIVAPWDPKTPEEQAEAVGWLWFALHDLGESEPIRRPLPIAREPYREIAAVAYASGFDPEPGKRQDRVRYAKTSQRHTVTFKTTVDTGLPALPVVRPALVQTAGKQILYAEVLTNYGDTATEAVGYETTLSYPLTVTGPVEVVIVEWVGHGSYYRPFNVYRFVTPA